MLKKSYFILVLLLNGYLLFSQKEDIQFEHLSMRDGLSMNPVMAIVQDKKGFLWFGTQDGLNQYDGYSFKVYKNNEDDSSSISDNFITAIYADSIGRLWIGTLTGGLNCFDYGQRGFKKFRESNSDLSADKIFSINEDNTGLIWIATEQGITLIQNDLLVTAESVFPKLKELNKNTILCIYHDSKNNTWIGTTSGLFLFNRQLNILTHFSVDSQIGISNNIVLSIFEDSNNTIWIGTVDGLNKLHQSETALIGNKTYYFKNQIRNDAQDSITRNSGIQNIYSIVNNYGGNTIRGMLEDNHGHLWIGTDMELIIFNPVTEKFINYKKDLINPAGINDHFIRSMYVDRSSVLWIGTLGNGINKTDLKPKKFRHYQKKINDPTSLSENYVRAVVEAYDGKMWVGTLVGGLNLFDPASEKFTAFLPNGKNDGTAPNDENVWSLCFENENTLWIGTNNGLNKYDLATKKFTYFLHNKNPESLSENTIRSIFVDSKGIVWIGTEGGLNKYVPETNSFQKFIENENDPAAISDNTVWKIIEAADGKLWIGTNNGLNLFDPATQKFKHYKNDPKNKFSLSHNGVRTLLIDDENRLWVGTQSGLNLFNKNSQKFIRFTEQNGLPNAFIYSIEQDYHSFIWISTNKGLARIDPITATIKTYDVYDGLQDYEFNTNASCKTRSGELYFGGPGGLNRFHPKKLKASNVDPNIEITLIKIVDKVYEGTKDISEVSELQLQYNENNLYFEFSSLDFSNPQRNQYSYMMEGFDEFWIKSGNNHKATYTNLDPGKYVFRVRGTNSDGLWSTKEKEIRIIISPPFWKTAWFYTLCVVLIFFIAFRVYKWRVKVLLREKKILEQKVDERTKDLEAEKQKIQGFNKELEKLSIVASKTDNAIIITDENGIIEWINESFVRMHCALEDYTLYYGKSILETTSNTELPAILNKAVREKRSMIYEAVSADKAGKRFVVQSTLTPIFDENDKLKKLVIIDTDITELKKSEEIIREKNKDITDSINYAVRIQRAILPDEGHIKNVFTQSFVYFKPKDIVSGDFYFIENIKTNELYPLSGFAVCDCTGHGVPGAFMSIIANNFLTQSLNEPKVNSPAEALDYVSQKILECFTKKSDSQAIRDGMDVAFCVLDNNTKNLYFAGANRPLVVITDGELKEIKGNSRAVGFHESNEPFTNHNVQLKTGDMIYIFSDGYIDQFGGTHGKKYKYSRFKELLLSINNLPVSEQEIKLNEAFHDWKGDLEQLDDICVMGIRI